MPNAMRDATSVRSHTWDDFNVPPSRRSRRVGWVSVHPLAGVAPASQTHVDEPRPVSRALNANYGRSVRCPDRELSANGRYLIAVHRLSYLWSDCYSLCSDTAHNGDAHWMGAGPELFAVVHRRGTPPLEAPSRQIRWIRRIPTTRGAETTMLNRFAILAALCVALPLGVAPLALADPPPPGSRRPGQSHRRFTPAPSPRRPPGSSTPRTAGTSRWSERRDAAAGGATDDRHHVSGVPHLGHFTGKITGGGKTKLNGGSMEAGEQIGCGIISDETRSTPA